MRILVLFHSTVLIPTGSRYMSSIPHCCADNLTYASNPSHHILTPQNEFLFFFYFNSYAFFKNFSIMKWRYMGSGSKAAVLLIWADLSSMLSSHCICAEDFSSPHCIEDCLDRRAGLGTVMKGIITSLACNWTPVAQAITSLLTDSLRSINFYSKIKSSFVHSAQSVRWPTANQLTLSNARVSRSECDIVGRTTFHKMQVLMDSTPPFLKIHTCWTLNIYTVLG